MEIRPPSKEHYNKQISSKSQKSLAKYLSAEEELKVATGYSTFYLRQRFIIQLLIPGLIIILMFTLYAYLRKINLYYGLSVGIFVSCLFSTVQTWIISQSHRYLLTNRRVIIKDGFFSVKLSSALYDKITHIEVDQELFERLFLHHGKVIVNTAGANQDALVLKYVEQPVEFKNVLERLIHKQNIHQSETSNLRELN